jgi:hypothetical protein
MFTAKGFDLLGDPLFFGDYVLVRIGLGVAHLRYRMKDTLPRPFPFDDLNRRQEHAIFGDVRFKIVTFLEVERLPHVGGRRHLRRAAHPHERHCDVLRKK